MSGTASETLFMAREELFNPSASRQRLLLIRQAAIENFGDRRSARQALLASADSIYPLLPSYLTSAQAVASYKPSHKNPTRLRRMMTDPLYCGIIVGKWMGLIFA